VRQYVYDLPLSVVVEYKLRGIRTRTRTQLPNGHVPVGPSVVT